MKHLQDWFKWITILLWWMVFLQGTLAQFDETFTLQNVWGRLQSGNQSLIQCSTDENPLKIRISRVMDTGQGVRLPPSSQQYLHGRPVFARILFMNKAAENKRFGVYQCKVVKKNIETRIVTLKLAPDELVELDAISPYNVANLGDDVELEVNVTKNLELPVQWMHDGKKVPEWDGLLKVELKDVQPKDAGIYECFYEGRRAEGVHALMRLIVRGCPADLYGENCNTECPPCYNGGICHDKWGVCVCSAGFDGENCETPCGGNHFGSDCNSFCSPPKPNSNTDELCTGFLFCKPDPYGCSCGPGFKGSKCHEHCTPGWYGADCKQPCHCAYGSNYCNRITGACDGGCARGFSGQSCQIKDADYNNTYIEMTAVLYCTLGTFGPSCEKICHCAENEHCHIFTGQCPSGCEDGWDGPTCGSCGWGRFGENCESTCHCEPGNRYCDKDGFCHSNCEAGWAGFKCQDECIPGSFGPNCASVCHCHENSSISCDKVTGECLGGCEARFMGKACQTSVLGIDDICAEPQFRVCSLPDDWNFPQTAAELDPMCSEFFAFLTCLDDYLIKCTPEDESRRKYNKGLTDLAEDMCQEDSPLHLGMVANLGCLKEVRKEEFGTCQKYSDEKSDAMIEKLDSIVEERGRYRTLTHEEMIPLSYHCLLDSLDLLCLITKSSERCGTDAKDIGVEIVSRNGYIDRSCPGSSKKNIVEYISLLELESEEEATLRQIMKNIMEQQ